MAKKAQTAKKAAAVKAPVKAKAVAKSAKAAASPKTAAKATPKVLDKAAAKKATQIPLKTTVKEKNKVQAGETSEKIKIDKSMTDDQIKWAEMYNKHKELSPAPYDMKASFKAATSIQHKVLGWGWIVSNENDRLEVLFKDGKRMLISNYRG